MSLMKTEYAKTLNSLTQNYIRLAAKKTNGYCAILSDIIELKEGSKYILQFKCISHKNKDITIKYQKNETLELIKAIKLEESTIINSYGGTNEYLCVAKFTSESNIKTRLAIGIEGQGFILDDILLDVREIALQEGELLLPYSESTEEYNSKIVNLTGKFELLADKFVAGISKVEKDITGLEERTNAKIQIESDNILQRVESVADGNLIINGAFESDDAFGWNIGGNHEVIIDYNYLNQRKFNYINLTPPIGGSSTWSNRFEVEGGKYYFFSGLVYSNPNIFLEIKIKFSNSIIGSNNKEENGSFDSEQSIHSGYPKDDSFKKVTNKIYVPPNAKSAYIAFEYGGDGSNSLGFTEIMIIKGEKELPYISKEASYSEVFQKLTPNSIINSVNKGLTEGGAISVASTILDENGFSQLNNGKLSVRLNNNGVHVYSFLNESKINGSVTALRSTATGDDVIGFANENNSYLTISYSKDASSYNSYMVLDKFGLLNPIPITYYENQDMNGTTMYLGKKAGNGSYFFGWKDGKGRGSSAWYTRSFYLMDSGGSGSLFTIDPDDAYFGANSVLFKRNVTISGDLNVSGNKNCIQHTKFGDVPFYANEDINSLLTETDTDNIYTTELVEDKYICRIEIDEIIQECINTTLPYNIYIDKLSWGDYKIEIREKDYFIVESDREMKFKYKLEGKRKGFEHENKENNFMQKATVQKPSQETETPSIQKREKEIIHKKPINEFWELYRCNNCN